MLRTTLAAVLLLIAGAATAQSPEPVFDAHLHAQSSPASATAMLAAMREANVTGAVLIGTPADLEKYSEWFGGSIPGLLFPCEDGRAANTGAACFEGDAAFPKLETLRSDLRAKKIRVLGEITAQYAGMAADDPRLEPFYALAEEEDVPVGIHLGLGPPGVAYAGPGFPRRKSPNYRGLSGDPRALEGVLVRHPKLRLYVMHAAWPFLEPMLYMLYMHPQLYVDISVLQYAIPRAGYYRSLQTLVDAGFGKRILFGSDGGAKQLVEGIAAIRNAPFLSAEAKRDILYDNAVRFFRLGAETPSDTRPVPPAR
jgi:hypothetical protein